MFIKNKEIVKGRADRNTHQADFPEISGAQRQNEKKG